MARTSVKIGIVMLFAWIIPLLGVVLSLIGLFQAVRASSTEERDLVRAGFFLNSLGLSLSLLLVGVSIYLVSSGAINPYNIINSIY